VAEKAVITPHLSSWDFREREDELRATAVDEIPTRRLANKGRQMLADVVHQLAGRIAVADGEERTVDKAGVELVRRLGPTRDDRGAQPERADRPCIVRLRA
jgi:hypothetical protein